jgi:hypothetical protein
MEEREEELVSSTPEDTDDADDGDKADGGIDADDALLEDRKTK